MQFETNKDKGRAGIALAIAYFASNGYTVSIPLDDTQDYDLVVEKDNTFSKVQCKSTGVLKPSGNYELTLKSMGGTKGTVYSTVKDSNADLLFALRADGIMYVIPVQDLTQKATISLCLEKSPMSRNDFDSSKYIVTI